MYLCFLKMSLSKDFQHKNDALDIKVHYKYHGIERCGLIDTTFNTLYGMDYTSFIEHLKSEIPQLSKIDIMRVCFLDEEKTYIDLTAKNFHRFLRLATLCFKSDVPKINLKVLEGASPLPQKNLRTESNSSSTTSKPKRSLFDSDEYTKTYTSPIELEIGLKRTLVDQKEKELQLLQLNYDTMWRDYNPPVYQDTSKSVCTRCHLRMGHSKNRCHMSECTTSKVCGNVDRHPTEKRELQEVGKLKQKVEGELNALKSELKIKQSLSNDINQSFEAKIHDILIRTNPGKYLTENRRPKEGTILADSYVIKKYYGGKGVDKLILERDSDIFQTIIVSHEEKLRTKPPQNSVVAELERRGINWPGNKNMNTPPVNAQSVQTFQSVSGYQPGFCNYPMSPYMYGFTPFYGMPTQTGSNPAASSPPPPPPSPPPCRATQQSLEGDENSTVPPDE